VTLTLCFCAECVGS